jgi:hypothetical protein
VSPATESVVPGREGYALPSDSRSGFIFLLLLIFDRGEGGSWPSLSWPKTKPVAAAATAVPVPMSYRSCRLASVVTRLERKGQFASPIFGRAEGGAEKRNAKFPPSDKNITVQVNNKSLVPICSAQMLLGVFFWWWYVEVNSR